MNAAVDLFPLQLRTKPRPHPGRPCRKGDAVQCQGAELPVCGFTYCRRQERETHRRNEGVAERRERNHQGKKTPKPYQHCFSLGDMLPVRT